MAEINYKWVAMDIIIISVASLLLLLQNNLYADSNIENVEAYLENGDRILVF